MAKPGEHNLSYTQGDDESYPFQVVREADDSPISLVDVTIECEVRSDFADNATVLATATCTAIDALNGIFVVELSKADTRAMGGERCKYDVQFTRAGKTRTYIKGDLLGTKEVTL